MSKNLKSDEIFLDKAGNKRNRNILIIGNWTKTYECVKCVSLLNEEIFLDKKMKNRNIFKK